jgi:hypothetical protein
VLLISLSVSAAVRVQWVVRAVNDEPGVMVGRRFFMAQPGRLPPRMATPTRPGVGGVPSGYRLLRHVHCEPKHCQPVNSAWRAMSDVRLIFFMKDVDFF